MSNIHETVAVSLTLEAAAMAPVFLPLADLPAGARLLPSQCTLTLTGVPSPLEVALMLCEGGTVLGDPGDAARHVGAVFDVVAGAPQVLHGGNVPPLEHGGTFGLYVPVQALLTGATVKGALSLVR